jgi:ribosome-associated heat shock protein Hsp15
MRDDRQRLDRWLWHARLVRTRMLAAELASSGRVRVNGRRVDTSSHAVKIGDVLTVALTGSVKVWKIAALEPRRGSAADAARLYEDLSPPPVPREPEAKPAVLRQPGSGRPTKRERRATDRLRQRGSHSE